MITNIDELLEDTLSKAATHAFETDDRDAYLCGAEFGARYVLLRLATELTQELRRLAATQPEPAR